MNATTVSLVEKIEAELDRLDCLDGEGETGGFTVDAASDLPLGWVALPDGGVTYYGPATAILAALAAVEYNNPTATNESEDHAGFTATHEALTAAEDVSERSPRDSQDWPSDLYAVEQLEEGHANDNPHCLVTVQTNGGVRYAAGPHGANSCALGDWILHAGSLAETREAAIEKGVGVE